MSAGPPYVCPHCLDEFDDDDRDEGFVVVTEGGVLCGMCARAGRAPGWVS